MKDSNFYSDDFEELLREKTEQYKMYPSEKVWKGVHNSLHTKRRWFIGSMALLVGGILFLAGRELLLPSAHPVIAKTGHPAQSGGTNETDEPTRPKAFPHSALAPFRSSANTTTASRTDEPTIPGASADMEHSYSGVTLVALSRLVISQPDISELLSHAVQLPEHAPTLPVVQAEIAESSTAHTATTARPAAAPITTTSSEDIASPADLTARDVIESLSARGVARNKQRNLARTKNSDGTGIAGGTISDSARTSTKASAAAIAEAEDRQRINWLHDYAMYTLVAPSRQARTFLQLTLSPTVNYRSLSGGEFGPGKFVPNAPVAPVHPGDAQRYVDHSPALGFQVGGNVLYRVTRNLSLKAGLQFNFSRYKIKAYASSSPQQATIALSSYYGYIVDSLTSYTRVGNFGGRTQETFSNDYFQLSAPLGFELRILGNERLQLNIGATIQPSYLLNTNSYMLSSDYMSYTKEPSVFRRWNFSGGLEAFLTYKLNGVRLQAGPEFRYQLLSTYISQYPLSENLKGYGFKLGIVKDLP